MTTSGLSTFGYTTENQELITEGFERIGRDSSVIGPVETLSALRSINLMFTDWANRGPNLFALDKQQIPLVANVANYAIPVDTVMIAQMVIEQLIGGVPQDIAIKPISREEYLYILNKSEAQNRPTQYYFERTASPVVYFWPVAQDGTCTAVYYRLRMIQNAGALNGTPDVANRWLEALCAGLAFRLAVKYAPDRMQSLKSLADEAYTTAAMEDREAVTMRVLPDLSVYGE